MRPAYLFDAELKPVSCLIPKSIPGAFVPGMEIKLTRSYNTEFGEIPLGTKGFVEYVDDETGLVEVLMEGIWPALMHWYNKLILVPFDTEDLTDCMVCGLRTISNVQELFGDKVIDNVAHLRSS
jgi:hypothetical protein